MSARSRRARSTTTSAWTTGIDRRHPDVYNESMAGLSIFDDVRPDLVPLLHDMILARAARTPSAGSNNVGGWKSGPDLLAWPGDAIDELRRDLVARLGAQPVAWAMVNRNGSFHARHVHGRTYTCGVYY